MFIYFLFVAFHEWYENPFSCEVELEQHFEGMHAS